ncbi:MAG: transposase [Elainellaceae cyanobacterium]
MSRLAIAVTPNFGQCPLSSSRQVSEIAESARHQVLFLPAYLPDFNKIEHDFAALKRILACAPDHTTLD